MVRKKSWFGLKCLFWSPKTWPEMSQSRLRNTRFCCHKHGWKCPMVSLRYLVLVSMNTAGDGLTSCGKYPDLVSTKTVGNVPIGFLRNIWFWPPQTWPEMARLPKKNIWIWSPQTWLEMSPGFLKTFFFFQKRLVLSPQTWLEIAWHSVNNIWLWSPQRQVSLKKYVFDHLKHGWRWSAFPRKIYRFCAHKNSWKLSWSLLEYSRFWSPQTLLEMSLGPLKAHLVLSPQTRLEMSTGDHHKHGDGPTSHEKHPVLVATKTAGNVQRCPLKKLFFFSHEHRWRWPNFLWTISHSLKTWRRLEKR